MLEKVIAAAVIGLVAGILILFKHLSQRSLDRAAKHDQFKQKEYSSFDRTKHN